VCFLWGLGVAGVGLVLGLCVSGGVVLALRGLLVCVLGVGLLLWSMPRESTIALMCMGKRENAARVVADLERGFYYRMAGFALLIVGLTAQLVGVVLGV